MWIRKSKLITHLLVFVQHFEDKKKNQLCYDCKF